MILQKFFRYDFSKVNVCADPRQEDFSAGFVLQFQLRKRPVCEETLLEFPGIFTIRYRVATQQNAPELFVRENLGACSDASGICPMFELELHFPKPRKPEWRRIAIALPLSLLDDKPENCQIQVVYNSVFFRVFLDGSLANEELPYGESRHQMNGAIRINADYIANLRVGAHPDEVTRIESERSVDLPLNGYTPELFNEWVGDVSTFYHGGGFHLTYLLDRRHHGNRWGGGAHYIRHLTSTDLVNWTDHGVMMELSANWQSVGTGTMVYHKGRYLFFFGWHTDRMILAENTLTPAMMRYYGKHAETCTMEADIPGKRYPSGTALAESVDGIHFTESGKYVHFIDNPYVCNGDKDDLIMYAYNGTWRSAEPTGPWRRIDPGFPHEGFSMPMRNSGECPNYFEWGDYRYLVMGVTGFWQARKKEVFQDSYDMQRDIYDGLAVPYVASYRDNRRILAGWNNSLWGGALFLRELIQYPDGHLGMKHLPETLPEIRTQTLIAKLRQRKVSLPNDGDILRCEMILRHSSGGRIAIRFENRENSGAACELQVDLDRDRAQWGDAPETGFCHMILSHREAIAEYPQKEWTAWNIQSPDGTPAHGVNFAIENVELRGAEYFMRVLLYRNHKNCGTWIDVELGRCRTLVTYRKNLRVDAMTFDADRTFSVENLLIGQC